MNIAEKYRPHYTYNDYCLWEGRWELIEGMPYAMSPAPTLKHQRIASHLNALFFIALKKCKKCKVYEPVDWKISEYTVLQPDLSVVFRPGSNPNFLDLPPTLIAEVLSPSTASKDKNEKYEIYQQQGVKYYIIADPAFNKLEVYELIDKTYQQVSINPSAFDFSLDDDCIASISFDEIFE